MSLIIPLACLLGGIGLGVVGTLISKRVKPDEAMSLLTENTSLKSDLEHQQGLVARNKKYASDLEAAVENQKAAIRQLKAAAESKTVKYKTPDSSNHTFSKEKNYLYFESTMDKNLKLMLEELTQISNGGNVAVKFTIKVVGSWKVHLREKNWTWHNEENNKTNKMSEHGKTFEFVGSPAKVVDEITTFIKDPYWNMYNKAGKVFLPNAPITFECQVRLSNSAKVKPKVKIVEVAVIEPEIQIVEKPVYIDRPVLRSESDIEERDDLRELIRAQVEVELAMQKRDYQLVQRVSN